MNKRTIYWSPLMESVYELFILTGESGFLSLLLRSRSLKSSHTSLPLPVCHFYQHLPSVKVYWCCVLFIGPRVLSSRLLLSLYSHKQETSPCVVSLHAGVWMDTGKPLLGRGEDSDGLTSPLGIRGEGGAQKYSPLFCATEIKIKWLTYRPTLA